MVLESATLELKAEDLVALARAHGALKEVQAAHAQHNIGRDATMQNLLLVPVEGLLKQIAELVDGASTVAVKPAGGKKQLTDAELDARRRNAAKGRESIRAAQATAISEE
jgi:hypothetical protein